MLIVHCRACGRTSIIMYVACFSCSTMVIHLPIEYYISTYWISYIYLLNIIYLPIEYHISTYWILYIYLLNIIYLPIEYHISTYWILYIYLLNIIYLSAFYDCITTSGGFGKGHIPADALHDLIRLTKKGMFNSIVRNSLHFSHCNFINQP